MMRTRALAVLVVAALAAGGLAGCGDDDDPGPGEDALLPAAELTFPGATETRRSFHGARSGRYIDGDTYDEDASLDRQLTLDEPTPPAEILSWYQSRLEDQGWGPPAEASSLMVQNQSDGVNHIYTVATGDPRDATTTSFNIQYRMTWDRP